MSEVKLTFTGSNEAFKRAALESANALEKLQQSGQSLTAETGKGQAAAERYIESLKREALQATLGEQAIRRYRLEKASLTAAARAEAESLIGAIEAHKRHEQAMESSGRMAEALGRRLGSLVNAAVTAGAALAVMITKEAIARAADEEQSLLRLNATVRATGQAAGFTADRIEQMVQKLKSETLFDDTQIREAASAILRFGNVSGETFQETLELSADIAAQMGTKMPAEAAKLARALEEPGKNLRALAEVGAVFRDEEIERIRVMNEAGRIQEAQAAILERVRGAVVDTAKEMNHGLKKTTVDVSQAWDDFLKTLAKTDLIGGNVSRALAGAVDVLKDLEDQWKNSDFRRGGGFALASAGKIFNAVGGGFVAPGAGDWMQRKGAALGAQSFIDASRKREGMMDVPTAGADALAEVNGQLARMEELNDRVAKGSADALAAVAKAAKRARDEYAGVKKSVEGWISVLEKEAATVGMTTEQKKLYEAGLMSAKLKTEEERKALMERTSAAAAALAIDEERRKQARHAKDDYERIQKIEKERLKALDDGTAAYERELEVLTKHNEAFGKSREAIERDTLAKLEAELAALDFAKSTIEEVKALEKRIELQRQIVVEGARSDVLKAGKREADETVKAYERANEQIKRSLTDAIMDGGKSAAQMLEGLFKNLVLRPVVEASVNAGMSLMGMGPQGGQGAGRGGPSLPGSVPGGFAGMLGTGISTVGGWVGSAGMAEFGAGMAGSFMGPTMAGSAASLGATFAQAIPYVGWAIAAYQILDSIFNDGRENPRVQLAFGRGGVNTGLGAIGFAQNQGGIDTPAAEQYFRTVTGIFSPLTAGLGADALGRIQGRLAATPQREFAFPEGDQAAQAQIFNETLRQIGIAVFQEVNPALAAFLETLDAADDRIPNIVQGFVALTDAGAEIDRVIVQITDDVMGPMRAQLDALETQQERARAAFDAALEGDDPMAVAQAQQALMTSIVSRYQAEMQMVRQLADQISAIEQAAYQFSLSIAQKINAVGGSIDTAAISMNRATAIRGGLSSDPGRRVGQIQDYVGAVDAWYAARRAEIERRMDQEAQASAAAAQAAASALQAQQAVNAQRIEGLQRELALTQQWRGVLDRITQIIDQMRLTATNPLAASGRLGLARGDSDLARIAYQGAAGEARTAAAGRYVEALQRQLGLAGEVFQRPSMEYQDAYNDIIRQLTEVQGEARTEAERALDLQAEIARLTEVQNALTERIQQSGAATAAATAQSSAELDALDAQARDYYEWARGEGETAYAEQERRHREQLDAITGGMDVELYMAQRQSQVADDLREIKEAILRYLDGFDPGFAGSGAAGSAPADEASRAPGPGAVTVNVNASAPVSKTQVIEAVRAAVPVIKRMLQTG